MTARFCVLGAGPVGLACAKALKEAGIGYLQLEATDHVGGNWAHGVYTTAHIISSRKTTEYPDWPMPSDYPDFPSAQQMCAYYEAFTEAHGLREHLRFEARVVAVRPGPDQRWEVELAGGEVLVFDGVIVANGHHWDRCLPTWATGNPTVLHSKDYKHPDQLRGQRVLVVGGGNSGCDLVSEAARVGACADWSLRRGYWFLPKTFLGSPTVELMKPWLPLAAQRRLIRAMIRLTVGRYADYGLPAPDHRIFDAHPTVSTEVFHYLKHGRIAVRPDVEAAQGGSVRFADGEQATYDVIACATGFHLSFPFLPDGLVPVQGKTAALYGGMLRPDCRHLYIAGAYQARYGLGPLVRPMAELIATWIGVQDQLEVPLGEVLRSLGVKPATSHLVGPHSAIRQMRLGQRMAPVLLRKGKALDRRRGPSALASHVA